MLGAAAVTVKLTPLLATPPTVTTTVPVVAPLGTGTVMLVALQLVGVPAVPLNVTVLVPCVAPKFAPAIITAVPTDPEFGAKLLMLGAGFAEGEVPPPLLPPVQPCSMAATANKKESVIRRLWKVVLVRNVILWAHPCRKHSSRQRTNKTPVSQDWDNRKYTVAQVPLPTVQKERRRSPTGTTFW